MASVKSLGRTFFIWPTMLSDLSIKNKGLQINKLVFKATKNTVLITRTSNKQKIRSRSDRGSLAIA